MKYYTTKPGEYPDKQNKNTEDEYFGEGWSIKKDGENYYLTYISGSLQGEIKKIEVSKDDFESARTGNIRLNDLCIKYNVT